jgi:hypothetical protein
MFRKNQAMIQPKTTSATANLVAIAEQAAKRIT